jgi:hypothetical protein
MQSIKHVFLGVSGDGSWCTFSNFQHLSTVKLNLLQYCLSTVAQCIKEKTGMLSIEGFQTVRVFFIILWSGE